MERGRRGRRGRRSSVAARIVAGAAVVAVGSLFLLGGGGAAVAQGLQEVFVVNFPDVQRVDGAVEVKGVVDTAEMRAIRDVLVPPVQPNETTRLVDAGVIDTEGFPFVVLSLHGEVKGQVGRTGEVGVYLVPEQPRIRQAFDEQGLMHFAMRATAGEIGPSTSFFASDQPRHGVGFQAYRAWVYNTTNKAVTVDLYAYLTN